MSDYILDDWKKVLDEFKSNVEKSLSEIRSSKAAVQQAKNEFVNARAIGRYIRDDDRIVISAPEIIIGNVDKNGNLWAGVAHSHVTIRANDVDIEGVAQSSSDADFGTITQRASSIRTVAVDPGIDGLENVVRNTSQIVSQARLVSFDSCKDTGTFYSTPLSTLATGISLHSDSYVNIDAGSTVDFKKKSIESSVSALKQRKSSLKSAVDNKAKEIDKIFADIEAVLKDSDSQSYELQDVRANIAKLDDIRIQLEQVTATFANALASYTQQLSLLAETCRQITDLEGIKGKLVSPDDFKNKPNGNAITLRSEKVNVACIDGDGNIRSNPEAGIDVLGINVSLRSHDADGALQPDGKFSLNAQSVNISTASTKYSDKKKRDAADIPALGDITVTSKNLLVQAVDSELKDKKVSEKALTKDGSVRIRSERFDLSATDTEGKATGAIALNAKKIEAKGFDAKKDDRSDDKLAAGSSLLLSAEKVFVGSKDSSNKTKNLQLRADKFAAIADTTSEVQQGSALLQLKGNNLSAGGSDTKLYGNLSIMGKSDFKGDVSAPKLSAKNLEAGTSFKSPNISDGIAVPVPAAPATLSSDVKAEDYK